MNEREIETKLLEYENLIRSTARRYNFDGMTFDDILQEFRMLFVKTLQDYEHGSKASLKTLFIRYVRYWVANKMREQERKFSLVNILDRNVYFGEGEESGVDYLESPYLNPSQFDNEERFGEIILELINESKFDYILRARIIYGKTLRELSEELGVSKQYIHKVYEQEMDKIKEKLKGMDYEIEWTWKSNRKIFEHEKRFYWGWRSGFRLAKNL